MKSAALFAGCCLLAFSLSSAGRVQALGRPAQEGRPSEQSKPGEQTKPGAPAATQPPARDPEDDLRQAIEGSGGSETQIIDNLEAFVRKYPDYRPAEIEREIFRLAIKLRDRDRAITHAEKLVTLNERDFETLTTLITLLRARRTGDDLKKALANSDKLVERVEAAFAAGKPGRISHAQWIDRKERSRASILLLRGQVLADLGETERAIGEFKRSYKAAKLAGTALALAELTEKRGAKDEAIDYYAQALAISFDGGEEIDRKKVRAKLGELYTAKGGAEAGLGDRLLKAYDQLAREREERETALTPPNINDGVSEAFEYKLTRLNGEKIKLGDYRGKVIVLNFWATWCGPCRIEMPLFEQTIAKYKNDPDVVFLAVTTDQDRELVSPFLKEQKYKLPVVFAESLDEHYAVEAIPTTIVIDRRGSVSFRQKGFNSREDFIALLSGKIEAAKKQ
jgi:thiol-disulfide isomerase/thioredoxin